jgi:hypothetical protein
MIALRAEYFSSPFWVNFGTVVAKKLAIIVGMNRKYTPACVSDCVTDQCR